MKELSISLPIVPSMAEKNVPEIGYLGALFSSLADGCQ
jgi:hypothetical protein